MAANVKIRFRRTPGASVESLQFGQPVYVHALGNLYVGAPDGTPILIGGSGKANAVHGHTFGDISGWPLGVTLGGTGRSSALNTGQLVVAGDGGVHTGYSWLKVVSASSMLVVGDPGCQVSISNAGSVGTVAALSSGPGASLVLASFGTGSVSVQAGAQFSVSVGGSVQMALGAGVVSFASVEMWLGSTAAGALRVYTGSAVSLAAYKDAGGVVDFGVSSAGAGSSVSISSGAGGGITFWHGGNIAAQITGGAFYLANGSGYANEWRTHPSQSGTHTYTWPNGKPAVASRLIIYPDGSMGYEAV